MAVEINIHGRKTEMYCQALYALEHDVRLNVATVGVLDADYSGESVHKSEVGVMSYV